MEKDIEKNILDRELDNLPDSISRYLFSDHFIKDVASVSQKFNLNEEQGGVFEDCLVMVLMNLEDTADLFLRLNEVIEDEDTIANLITEALKLAQPFFDDIAEVEVRRQKEIERFSLKHTAPEPPPAPPKDMASAVKPTTESLQSESDRETVDNKDSNGDGGDRGQQTESVNMSEKSLENVEQNKFLDNKKEDLVGEIAPPKPAAKQAEKEGGKPDEEDSIRKAIENRESSESGWRS